MVYTVVLTKTVGDLFEAADFNTYIKDNFAAGVDVVQAKGDLLVASAAQVAGRLPVGSNGEVLVADSGEALGVKWDDRALVAGIIIIWSGAIVDIPGGWQLCNGTNGTPDLRGRFVVGAGSTYAVDASGGSAAKDLAHSHTLTIDSGGSHTHTISTNSENAHVHTASDDVGTGEAAGNKLRSSLPGTPSTVGTITHTHAVTANSPGPNAAHSHPVSSMTGAWAHTHTHTGTEETGDTSLGETEATMPQYYALAFIQRVDS